MFLRVLCLAGLARCFVLFASPILQSLGKAHRAAVSEWFSAGVHVTALIIAGVLLRDRGIEAQIVGVASARLAAQFLVISPVLLLVVSRAAQVSALSLLSPLRSPVLAAATGIGAGLLVDELCIRADLGNLLTLLIVGTVSSFASVGALLIASPEARRLVVNLGSRFGNAAR